MVGEQVGAELVSEATARLAEAGIEAEVLAPSTTSSTDGKADALLTVTVDDRTLTLHAWVAPVTGPGAPVIANILRELRPKGDGIVITQHVSASMAQRLREHGVQFLDAAGNMYLRQPGIRLWVTGRGRRTVPPLREQPSRVFRRAGLQIVFGLLARPELVRAPYREIAHLASVSLGSVPPVVAEMRELGYIVGTDDRRSLAHQDRLLTAWAPAYAQTLRPKLLMDRFRADDPRWWSAVQPSHYDAAWGSETAAALLTNELRPEITTIYADALPHELIVAARLRRDPDGNVDVRRRFWIGDLPTPHPDVVPVPLVYADLLAAGDARTAQTAERLRETFA